MMSTQVSVTSCERAITETAYQKIMTINLNLSIFPPPILMERMQTKRDYNYFGREIDQTNNYKCVATNST